MKYRKHIIPVLFLLAVFCSCVTNTSNLTKEQAYKSMYDSQPLSVAVMPPINRTNNVEAKEYFFYTLSRPLAEQGYYVFPAFLTMELYKSESAYDAELYLNGSLGRFKEVLGADAVLFTTINKWEKAALSSKITVDAEYILKSTTNDEILFHRKGHIVYDASVGGGGGGLFGALVDMAASAINTAATAHVKVARACNNYTLSDMPAGSYSPKFGLDKAKMAGKKEFSATVK